MKTKILISILFLVLQSCNKTTQKKSEKDNSVKTEVIIKKDRVKQDTITLKKKIEQTVPPLSKVSGEVIWFKGYLDDIAVKYYGNKAYALPLAVYNNLKDSYQIKKKIELHIPPFSEMIKNANLGFNPSIYREADMLLQARELYVKREVTLQNLRINGENPVVVPKIVKADLDKAISLINKTIISLKKKDNSPIKMIGQLEMELKNLKKLSNGSNDGYGYDLDMVHQRLAHAFKNGILWSREKNP